MEHLTQIAGISVDILVYVIVTDACVPWETEAHAKVVSLQLLL